MFKKAYLLLLASALIFPVGIASFSSGVDAETIEFMRLWPSGAARQHNLIANEIVEEFEATHPGVTIEVEVLENEQYKNKVKVLAASNSLPDVGFTWAAGYMSPFVEGNLYAPLDDVLNDGLGDLFVPGTTAAYAVDGTTYGLPLELNIAPIFYNKKIFRENGVDVPKTYEEFLDGITTLRSNGVTPIALGNKERWTGSLWYMYLADRFGGPEVLNRAIDRTGSFEHPALIQAAAEIQTMVDLGAFSRGFNGLANAEAKAQFLNGQAAMWLIGSWELPNFTTDETVPQEFRDSIGYLKFPPVEGGGGDIDSWVGGPGVGLFVAQDSNVKDLAKEFAAFFISRWGERAVAEAGVIPATKVDTSDIDLPQMYLDVLDDLSSASNITLFADVQMPPSAAQTHLNMIQALFGNEVTPEVFASRHESALESAE